MYVALLRWEQFSKASVKNVNFPRAISAACEINEQLSANPSRKLGSPSHPRVPPGLCCLPSQVTASCLVYSWGLTAPLAAQPPPPSLLQGHSLEGRGRVSESPGLPLLRPPLTLAVPDTCRPPQEGTVMAQAQGGVIFKDRAAAEVSRNRCPNRPRLLCPETQDGGRGAVRAAVGSGLGLGQATPSPRPIPVLPDRPESEGTKEGS